MAIEYPYKVTVKLTDDERRSLEQCSVRWGKSMSELLRGLLAQELDRTGGWAPQRQLELAGGGS